MNEIRVTSTLDGSPQPSLFDLPEGTGRTPLLVGLHTWKYGRASQVDIMLPETRRLGWALLLPEFRGPNTAQNPRAREACGSALARQDIVDAADAVLRDHGDRLDPGAVFLLGGSGGGHMALLMAAHHPQRWRAVSAWCPITDLAAWYRQSENYRVHIAACCGGSPEEQPDEYAARSPMTLIDGIAQARVHLHHGRWDGVRGSVPYTHSLTLYNRLLERHPDASVYLSIFDGGHEVHPDQAVACFRGELSGTSGQNLTG